MRIKVLVSFLLIGGAIIGAALFAEAIGLDNDPGWGKGRIAIFVFGVLVVTWGIFHSLYKDTALSIARQFQSFLSESITGLFVFIQRYWYTFPILVFVILVYIWFASSGSWTHWEPATHRYADLAISFRQGNLHLAIQPNSEILSLPDPYDPLAREGINYPVDYSLYEGRYYFYWGPVPALILAAISSFTRGRVGDLYLVFSFVGGIFLLQFLLAIDIWDRFFRPLPKWILAVSVLVLGLITPWTYILINEPNGRIYEAAISGAQFFLMSGFLVVVVALRKPVPSSLALALTGFFWVLAIGTRLTIALPIGCVMFTVVYRIWKTLRSSPMSLATKLTSLGLPLILGLVGIGWYNWARFGSVAETGFSYALAGTNMHKYQSELWSPIYIAQNLYAYIFQPPASMAQSPFLYPTEVNPVIGLFFIAPFTIFAILPVVNLFMKAAQKRAPNDGEKDNNNDLLDWITISLFSAFVSAFGFLLIFFWIAIRYLADLMPALAMLSVLGFWKGYQFLSQRPIPQRVYAVLGIVLASISFIVNILISIAVKQFGRTGL